MVFNRFTIKTTIAQLPTPLLFSTLALLITSGIIRDVDDRHLKIGPTQLDVLSVQPVPASTEHPLVLGGNDADKVVVDAVPAHLSGDQIRDAAEEGIDGGDLVVPADEAGDAGAVAALGLGAAVGVLHGAAVEHVLVPGQADGDVEEECGEHGVRGDDVEFLVGLVRHGRHAGVADVALDLTRVRVGDVVDRREHAGVLAHQHRVAGPHPFGVVEDPSHDRHRQVRHLQQLPRLVAAEVEPLLHRDGPDVPPHHGQVARVVRRDRVVPGRVHDRPCVVHRHQLRAFEGPQRRFVGLRKSAEEVQPPREQLAFVRVVQERRLPTFTAVVLCR